MAEHELPTEGLLVHVGMVEHNHGTNVYLFGLNPDGAEYGLPPIIFCAVT